MTEFPAPSGQCLLCTQPAPPDRQFCPDHQPHAQPFTTEPSWTFHHHDRNDPCRCADPQLDQDIDHDGDFAIKWSRHQQTGHVVNSLILRWSNEPGDGGIECGDLLDIIAARIQQQKLDMMSYTAIIAVLNDLKEILEPEYAQKVYLESLNGPTPPY